MANIRIRPGMFLKIVKELGPLKVGQIVQVLSIPTRLGNSGLTFVGVDGEFSIQGFGKHIEPIIRGPIEDYISYYTSED